MTADAPVPPSEAASGRAPSRRRPLPGPFVAAMAYAVRACVPPRRWALLALPAVGAVVFGALANVVAGDSLLPAEREVEELSFLVPSLLGFILPFACLVVGDAVLGAERRSGQLALTWLSPAPFAVIVVARWAGAVAVANAALAPAVALAAVVAGHADAAGVLVLSTLAGSAAYLAIFMTFGIATQRGMLWSLGFVMVVEQTVANLLTSVAQLSPQFLARAVYAGIGPAGDELLREGMPSGWGAVLRLVLLTAVALGVTEQGLRRATILTGAD